MKSRKFTFEEQLAFAELSGDYNPLHIDAVAARRLIVGSPVLHGVHSLLWGLDNWLQGKTVKVTLGSIKACFHKAIKMGDEVSYSLKSESDGHVKIELLARDSLATVLEFDWVSSEGDRADGFLPGHPRRRECRVLSASEVEKASGSLDVHLDLEASGRLFGYLTGAMPPLQIAQLLTTTRLVGMECPGLHSVYSMLDLAFGSETGKASVLTYEIKTLDKRFGLASMNVRSPGMSGTVKAFLRPPPQEQIDFGDLRNKVSSVEFAEQRALIVGGSRGLGEVTAKLLAAGGAEVKITYCRGANEARRVVDDIVAGGGSAETFAFDVLDHRVDVAERLAEAWAPTHLYYFATPFIAAGTKRAFSASLFREFCDYYVVGFLRTVEQLRSFGLKGILYPSSVFVDELPTNMGEYAAAKAAGEVLCAFLDKTQRGVTVYNPRLPRMATDQTASFLPVDNQDPVPIMLEHLRSFTQPARPLKS